MQKKELINKLVNLYKKVSDNCEYAYDYSYDGFGVLSGFDCDWRFEYNDLGSLGLAFVRLRKSFCYNGKSEKYIDEALKLIKNNISKFSKDDMSRLLWGLTGDNRVWKRYIDQLIVEEAYSLQDDYNLSDADVDRIYSYMEADYDDFFKWLGKNRKRIAKKLIDELMTKGYTSTEIIMRYIQTRVIPRAMGKASLNI